MKKLAIPLLKCIPEFGMIAASTTLLYWVVFGESPLVSDDGYVMGWAVSCFILPGLVFYILFTHYPWKWLTGLKAYCIHLFVVMAYLLCVVFAGELHAPGIAIMLMITIFVFAPLSLGMLKWLDHLPFLLFSSFMTVLYLGGLAHLWYRLGYRVF
jgi:hypothetical protein